MRRFECREGTSNKFWEIAVEGKGHTVRFGAIGTDGQIKKKAFGSPAEATTDADKLVREKLKKGYVEVGGGKAAAAVPKPAKASKGGGGDVIAQLDAIADLATNAEIEAFQAVLEKLTSGPKKDAALLTALLGVLERSQGQDDFGLYATAEMIIDEFPDKVRAEGLRQSIRRAVNWKVLELVGDSKQDIAALQHALSNQQLGSLEDEVRGKLEELGVEPEDEDDDGESDGAPATANAAARDDDAFLVVDDGQGIHLHVYTADAIARAHRAAPDAFSVRITKPDEVDAAAAKRLLSGFPLLDLPKTHPWFDFATGPVFEIKNGELGTSADAVLAPRLDHEVSIVRSKRQLSLTWSEITPERIAAAKALMPDAALVEVSGEHVDAATAKLLLKAFPSAMFAVGDRDLAPEALKALADRLTVLEISAAQVAGLPALPKLRKLRIHHAYDDKATKQALAKISKLAASPIEELEIANDLAPGLAELKKLPLRALKISRGSDTPALSSAHVAAIAAFGSLRELAVWCPVDSDAFAAFEKLPQTLERFTCCEGADKFLAAAGKLRGLRVLCAPATSVSDAGVQKVAGLPLDELQLSGKKVTDAALATIRTFTKLRDLTLDGVSFTDAGLAGAIAALPELASIRVEDCKGLGDKTFAALVRAPRMLRISWSGGGPIGKAGIAALGDTKAVLQDVMLSCKVDDAGFTEALRYKQKAPTCPLRLHDLSKKQSTQWKD